MSSRRSRHRSGKSTPEHDPHVPVVERPADDKSHRFPSLFGRSKLLVLLLSVAIVAGASMVYYVMAVRGATDEWFDPDAKNLMIVVEAHTDDFDIGVSGQAFMYQRKGAQVMVAMVSDVTSDYDSYNYGVSKGLFKADMKKEVPDVTPDGQAYGRGLYSRNCANYRIGDMIDGYNKFGFFTVLPRTPFPDGGGLLPAKIRDSFLIPMRNDLKKQLSYVIRNSGATNVAVYCHDPDNHTGEDHAWAGRLGVEVYKALKADLPQVKFHGYLFYVYTYGDAPINGFSVVDVSQEYAKKIKVYEEIYEYLGKDLKYFLTSLNRTPEAGHDYWFRNELRKKLSE
jgi:LmbE family N-acetylglucosaminyl deacetylase